MPLSTWTQHKQNGRVADVNATAALRMSQVSLPDHNPTCCQLVGFLITQSPFKAVSSRLFLSATRNATCKAILSQTIPSSSPIPPHIFAVALGNVLLEGLPCVSQQGSRISSYHWALSIFQKQYGQALGQEVLSRYR